MPNSKNIMPYANFSHTAAQYGGPDPYINKLVKDALDKAEIAHADSEKLVAQANFNKGLFRGCLITAPVVLATVAVVEYGRRKWSEHKTNLEEKARISSAEATQARELLQQVVEESAVCDTSRSANSAMDTQE